MTSELNPQWEHLTKKARYQLMDELAKEHPTLALNVTYPQVKDGVSVSVGLWPDGYIYIYALPWARGWSVFVDDRTKHDIPTWNTVKDIYKGLQRPLHCSRGVTGCWTVPTRDIVKAVNELAACIRAQNLAKRNVYMAKNWPRALYWYFMNMDLDKGTYVGSHRHDLPWSNWPDIARKSYKRPK